MTEETKKEYNTSIKELKNSEIEINGEIPALVFESYYKKALIEIGKDAEIPGFRKGHVPEKILIQKVGENTILYEMAELALADFYPQFMGEQKIEAVGRPEISITKIARGNPLGFKIKTAVWPSFTLPNYKDIAQKVIQESGDEKIFIEDKEVEQAIEDIRKNFAQYDAQNKKLKTEGAISGAGGNQIAEGENKELPELTDEFVKKLGAFETVEDFKNKIRENLLHEKETRVKEKKRIAIIDGVLQKITVTLPQVLVDGELERMFDRFKGNISAMGHVFEDYLSQIKKTEAELKEGWRKDAEKSVKTQLLLQKIAEAEHITVPKEELEKEIEHVAKHYKDADRNRVRNYVEGALIHEKTFQFLEGQSKNS